MNMIRFNAATIIEHLGYVDEIYIVCQSAARSQFIKDKYFGDYTKIKVNDNLQFSRLSHGSNKVVLSEHTINVNVEGSNSFNYYSVMRIIQTLMGIVMLLIGIIMYVQLKNKKLLGKINTMPLIILILFGLMALYNGLTSTCSLSTILKDGLN